jgi:hypothetical protein
VNRAHFLRLVGAAGIGLGTGVGDCIDFEFARPKTHLALIVSHVDPRWVLVSSHDEALRWLKRNFTPKDETIEIHDKFDPETADEDSAMDAVKTKLCPHIELFLLNQKPREKRGQKKVFEWRYYHEREKREHGCPQQ